jgi:hypothetical protein
MGGMGGLGRGGWWVVTRKGSVSFGDLTLPIDDIYLAGGAIVIECRVPAQTPLCADHYDVYDRNGQLLYRSPRCIDVSPFAGTSVVAFELLIAGQTSTPGPVGVVVR